MREGYQWQSVWAVQCGPDTLSHCACAKPLPRPGLERERPPGAWDQAISWWWSVASEWEWHEVTITIIIMRCEGRVDNMGRVMIKNFWKSRFKEQKWKNFCNKSLDNFPVWSWRTLSKFWVYPLCCWLKKLTFVVFWTLSKQLFNTEINANNNLTNWHEPIQLVMANPDKRSATLDE